jgi:hypothetical protein
VHPTWHGCQVLRDQLPPAGRRLASLVSAPLLVSEAGQKPLGEVPARSHGNQPWLVTMQREGGKEREADKQ